MQMTDTNWNTLIIASGTFLTTIVTGIVALLLAKINRKTDETKEAAKEAAVKVEEVKTALANLIVSKQVFLDMTKRFALLSNISRHEIS